MLDKALYYHLVCGADMRIHQQPLVNVREIDVFYIGKCFVSLLTSLIFVSLFLVDLNILLPLAVDFELAAGLVVGFFLWSSVLMHLLLVNRWQSVLFTYFVLSIALGAVFLVLR